jgi:hypothetical protein
MAQKVFRLLKTHLSAGKITWEDWILLESSIRTAMVYFLLTLVVSMEYGLPCSDASDWRIEALPVPAAKVSWEADGEDVWRGSFCSRSRGLVFGDLLDEGCELIEEWEEGVDEFGVVVGMARGLYTTLHAV